MFFYSKMKIFEILQQNYKLLGIEPSNQLVNKRVLFAYMFYAYFIASQCAYIFHVANGFMEYVEGICATSSSVIIFICFTAVAFKKTTLFKIIDNAKKLIATSELVSNWWI